LILKFPGIFQFKSFVFRVRISNGFFQLVDLKDLKTDSSVAPSHIPFRLGVLLQRVRLENTGKQ